MPHDDKRRAGWTRKIITAQSPEEIAKLRQALALSGGKIVKELPLVHGLLCEFPADSEVLLKVRDNPERFTIDEDVEFRTCEKPRSFFPFSPFFPGWQPPAPPRPPRPPIEQPRPPIQAGPSIDWGLKRIGAPQVWDKLSNRRVAVGIIDTGIDPNHPDLRANFRGGYSSLSGHTTYDDDNGHGTHIAGTIGAYRRFGMVGVNPFVDLYAVKAFNHRGSGSLSDIITGVDWLLQRRVQVINMSFSTDKVTPTFERLINVATQRGVVLVAAAGNDGGSNSVNYPAKYPQVITVSATTRRDGIASFSSTGPEVDFCAPGEDIRSTWPKGGYKEKSGTSFAAPHVTGVVADIINFYGPLSVGEIREIMKKGAVPLKNLTKEQQGLGMIELPKIIV